MTADMDERVRTLVARARRCEATLRPIVTRIASLRRRMAELGRNNADEAALRDAEAEVEERVRELKQIETELTQILGVPEEVIEAIEAEAVRGDEIDRRPRNAVLAESVAATNIVEDELPTALERLLSAVDPSWLRAEMSKGFHLDDGFLREPLSIIRGCRIASERRSIHRFAQLLLVAYDCLTNDPRYDLFAGALLVPQAAALGRCLKDLSSVGGPVQERVASLWRLSGDKADATAYELLVAAACARRGRQIEFLPTTQARTPDLRVHDYAFPLVVECKRKQAVNARDVDEERAMRGLFIRLRDECLARGIAGVFKLHLTVQPSDVSMDAVVDAAIRQPHAVDSETDSEFAWGRLAFHPLTRTIDTPRTRLYSPVFLHHVFGWNTDIPSHDGLICQVRDPDGTTVDGASDPLGLFWTNAAESVQLYRARTAAALFSAAVDQIPPGEVGIVYVCYQEGDRAEIADDRTRFLSEQLEAWEHDWHIRAPATIVSRILPRPLGHGTPDLIETGLRFLSSAYGDPVWFASFPTTVFTW